MLDNKSFDKFVTAEVIQIPAFRVVTLCRFVTGKRLFGGIFGLRNIGIHLHY
jgi:hypothetical protein